jgi:multidrug resistance efflux pump
VCPTIKDEVRSRIMNRIFWVVGVILLIGTLVGVGRGFNNTSTTHVEPAPPPAIMAVGYIDGEFGVSKLYPLQPGRLVETASEGKFVKKGTPLLALDEEIATLKVKEAKADLDATLAQQKQSRHLPEQRRLKLEQQSAAIAAVQLKQKSATNELDAKLEAARKGIEVNASLVESYRQKVQELDELIKVEKSKLEEINLIDPTIDMARADADVASKKVRMEQAQWALDQCKLLAPADGTVLRVHVNPGEVLGPNPQRPAIEFLTKGDLIVRAEVLQEWAGRVKLDQEVEITDDTFQGPSYKGKVYFLSPWFTQKRNLIIEPFTYNDVRFLECLVRVTPEGDLPLRVGQRVRMKIKS